MKKILLLFVLCLTVAVAHADSASSYTTIPAVNAGDKYFTSQNSTGTTYNTTEAQLQAFLKANMLGGVTVATSSGTFTVTSSGTLTLTGTGVLNINGGGTLGSAAFTASTAYEPALGNPGTNGFVLSSTTSGTRTWISVSAASGALIAVNNLGDLPNVAAAQAHLGLTPGTNVEDWSATLDTLAAGNPFIAGTGISFTGIYPALTINLATGAARVNLTGGSGTLDLSGFTVTLPSATRALFEPALGNPGTDGFVLSSTASGTRSWVSPVVMWELKTSSFTAVKGHKYQIDTSSGAITVTLPVSATAMDSIDLADATLSWSTNNVTLARNGLKINNGTTNYTASVTGNKLSVVYISSGYGWSIK